MEALQDAVDSIGILQAMFFGDGEFSFYTDEDQQAFERLSELCASDGSDMTAVPDRIRCTIRLIVQDHQLVFVCKYSTKDSLADQLLIPYASNDWLSREAHDALVQEIQQCRRQAEQDHTSLFDTIQHIQTYAETLDVKTTSLAKAALSEPTGPVTFVRQWIWFPMIYTREKRGHIISWAPSYHITGFLCPGKPGCLCLEGTEKQVGNFINDIKTISWADIPASHRKMTTRWQEKVECVTVEDMDHHRRFKDMTQVTFELHGNFGNHNNLSLLQAWMQERGCGEAFEHLFEFES